jgi:hypothetical protein
MRTLIISLTVSAIAAAGAFSQDQSATPPSNCRISGGLIRLQDLPEASGIAASRRTPGVFWAHNDSGDPVLFAIDQQGSVKGRVRVTGARVDDWEDIAVGPCPQGTCVYIADIGDNGARRKHVTLYRVPEPAPGDAATANAEAFNASYPDGPHDAESLFVTRDSGLFVITKGDPGAVALYRFPRQLTQGTTMQLERVGEPVAGPNVEAANRPTAADVSPDGRWVVVRTTKWLAFYAAADLTAGRWREAFRMDLTPLDEPRGEGITFGGRDSLVLVSEGGGLTRRPGTLARVTCTLRD